jgi:hypothetical protein
MSTRTHSSYFDPGNLLSAETVCCGFRSLSCSTKYTAVVPSEYSTISVCPFLWSAPIIFKGSLDDIAILRSCRIGWKRTTIRRGRHAFLWAFYSTGAASSELFQVGSLKRVALVLKRSARIYLSSGFRSVRRWPYPLRQITYHSFGFAECGLI